MSREPKALSPAQAAAVNEVKTTSKHLREGKAEAAIKYERLRKEEVAALELAQALAVRRAAELGVPKTRIGIEGLGTTNPSAANRILDRTKRMVVELVENPIGVFEWDDKVKRIVRVNFENYPTTSIAPEYPTVLSGLVTPDESQRNGWRVIVDDGDVETDFGKLPGFLHWEIEDVPAASPGSITQPLNEWIEANA